MTARQTESASSDVGYCKPPRHTQFRKGQSGNPGGRPRRHRESIERLKELTLQEAYRGVAIRDRNGIAQPAFAIEAILRSQIELAMKGDIRAQRDIQAYEREDKKAAALEEYTEWLVYEGWELDKVIREGKSSAKTVEQKIDYVSAARRVAELLRLDWPPKRVAAERETVQSQTCAAASETDAGSGGVPRPTAAGTPPIPDVRDRDAERSTAVPAPPADLAPQPENGTASPPPAASRPAADEPAAPAVRPWSSRPRPERRARNPARESAPSPGADLWAGRLHNRLPRRRRLHHRRGNSGPPFNVTSDHSVSRHDRWQKSADSLLNSLFSGNAAGRSCSSTGGSGRGGGPWR